jgi:hypothetical protein
LEIEFLSKHYHGVVFNTGDEIRQEMFITIFHGVRKTKVPMFYRWLIDSGVYNRLELEKMGRMSKQRISYRKEKKDKIHIEGVSSLEGGLVTLFVLCGGFVSLALISIVIECRLMIWKSLSGLFLHLFIGFKKCIKFKRLKFNLTFNFQF